MKNALIYYKNTDNLGDDILTYAGKRFFEKIDYYIDREEMDIFVPEEQEPVLAILNGWYLHYNYTFPPSPYIVPCFVGTHFGRDKMLFGDYSYLDGYASEYLRRYEPIGCRDTNTLNAMQEKGINGYFSGCLTLTLEPYEDVEKNDAIILTDVSTEIEKYVSTLLEGERIICKTHVISKEERGQRWEMREKRVEEYLKLYQGAKVIITSRLHCALPAIALGTPVILVGNYDEDYYERIADYAKYCNCCSIEEILNGTADSMIRNPVKKQDINEIRTMLIQRCERFVEAMENQKNVSIPDKEQYVDLYVKRTEYMRRFTLGLLQNRAILSQQYAQDRENLNKLLSISQTLLRENEQLQKCMREQE